MGFRISWDKTQIIRDIKICAAQVANPYNDGYTGWHCKKDLLDIQYELEQILQDLPNFSSLESEYFQQREKTKVWLAISKK